MPYYGWTWKRATPRERGEWVRVSWSHCLRRLPALCDLFGLTEQGAVKILAGDDWRPEYRRQEIDAH